MCKITAMLGLTPKLLWSGIHEGTDSPMLVSFRRNDVCPAYSGASGFSVTNRRYAWWIAFTTW
jgi:hypothetical protein